MKICRLLVLFCMTIVTEMIYAESHVTGYFLDSEDVTLEYVRKSVSDGKFQWRHAIRVISTSDMGREIKYTTESLFSKANGKPLYKSGVIETTYVDKSTGNVSLDLGNTMISYIKARAGLTATGKSMLSSIPATVEPGDTLAEITVQAKVGPLTYSAVVNDRKVLRRETVSVPAGTFECIVVKEHKVESGPGHNRDVINYTWYSKGLGFIRHDTYIKGKLDTSEILQSIQNNRK